MHGRWVGSGMKWVIVVELKAEEKEKV